jgi:hypothetical protein
LSDKLSALLASGDSPVVGPKTADALQAYLDGPWPEPERPTQDRIDAMVSRLSLATKERRPSEQEARERLDLYWRALRDCTMLDLAAAFDDLLRTSTFMPTPAEVFQRASAAKAKREYRKSRARHLVWKHKQEWRKPIPDDQRITAEEFQALRSIVAGSGESDGKE